MRNIRWWSTLRSVREGQERELYFERLHAAADENDHDALIELAEWKMEGDVATGGRVRLPRSFDEAERLLRRALQPPRRGGLAALLLAQCLTDNDGGLEGDLAPEQAMTMLRRAAARGNATAAWNLACEHRMRRQWRLERCWLHRAAHLGDESARLALLELALRNDDAKKSARARAHLQRRALAPDAPATYGAEDAHEILERFVSGRPRRYTDRLH